MFPNLKRVFGKMREGLRSHTQRTTEKGMIDLNKDPVEDDGSSTKSPPSSVYFSAEDKIDHGLDVDVSSNAVGEGGEEARGTKGDTFERDGGGNSEGFEGKVGSALPLTNEGLVKEGLSGSGPLEGNRDAATFGVLGLSSSSGVEIKSEATGKGRRGRKRKTAGTGLLNSGALEEGSAKKEEIVKVARTVEDSSEHEVFEHRQEADIHGNVRCALPLTNVGVIKEGLSKSRPLEGDGHAAAVHVLDLNASGGSEIKDEVAGKRRRGRKRKMVGCGLPNAGGLERSSMTEGSVKVERTEEDVTKHEVSEHGQDVDMGGNVVCALPSFCVGSVRKGLSDSRPFEGYSDADIVDVLDLNASGSVKRKGESAGKGRPGRQRKMVGCAISSAGNLEGVSMTEEETVTVASEDDNKHEVLEHGHATNMDGNVAAAPAGNTDEGKQESSKGRRGRKKKVLENSGGSLDSRNAGGEIKRLALDGTPQIVGRVLRSRTREANSGEKQACTKEKGLGDRKGEMDLDRSGNRNVEMKIEESTRPAGNIKRGRGRPPKIHGRRNGSSKVTVNNKANLGPRKNIGLPRTKVVKGHNLVKLRKKKVKSTFLKVHKGNSIDKKEGDMRPKEEKQLLKDQIVTILKEAGWTVQHRPRNGRDYLDAVYVDGQGRTHWSVTLAYRKLKAKIEDQTADEKEISAFSPIPGDQLSKLFRITRQGKKSKKGLKVGGSKTRNGWSKERPKKKSSGECIAVSKSKANTTSVPQQGERFFKKQIEGVNSEPENSVEVSSRRKTKSRRGGSRKPCGLSVRESNDELDEGKRTLLLWMIDMGTISPGGKVQYMSHERADLTFKGKIAREGICCDCCSKIFTLIDFERHAGSLLGQPLQNICLESGKSLLQCMLESWGKLEKIDHVGFNFVDVENDPDDDTCNICADGGNLICCDGCPSTFHQNCLQIQNFPTGDWHCVYCSCKFCGRVCWGSSKGDDVWDPDDSGFFTCLFCEEKFHVNCMLKKEATSINTELLPFCGRGCQKLFENLQKLLGVKHELEKGYSWTILRRQDVSCSADLLKVESNSKLAIAFSIIDECFTPITDERSNINLIRSVCYSCGSNLRRLNYSGFCTFILEKSDELVSAATIRIHGNQLAEMPFIGTRGIHRRKGMASMLLTAIEMVLSSLDVEKLVIPAVSELSETWTKVFGFVPLEESERQEMKYMSLVLFPGADMLQKRLHKRHLLEGETPAGAKLSEPSIEHVNGNTTPADSASAATVASALRLTDDYLNHVPGAMNGLANSITFSKVKLCHDFHASEDKLVNCKSETPERNQVDKVSCVPEEGKEALPSQHKTVIYSQ